MKETQSVSAVDLAVEFTAAYETSVFINLADMIAKGTRSTAANHIHLALK